MLIEPRCPLWVKSRPLWRKRACPLYPRKQTFAVHMATSAKAKSGHSDALFDHLIGTGEYGRRHSEAERLGRFQIERQLVLGRRLHRKVGGLLALKDAVDIAGRLTERGDSVGAVRDQAAVFHETTKEVHRGQSVLGRQCDDQLTMNERCRACGHD